MTRTMTTCQMTGTVPAIARSTQADRANLVNRAWLVYAVWKERRALASLDDRALKDIGLSRADVEHEVSRNMLDVPGRRI